MTDLKSDLASLKLPGGAPLASRRRRRLLPLFIVIVAAIGVATWWSGSRAVEVETLSPAVESSAGAPAGSPVLTASGYVVARRRAVVSAKIQGRLAELLVEEGDRVTEGQVFARLESADFRAAVDRSRAALLRAAAQIAAVEAQIEAAAAAAARAEADLHEMRRQASVAERLHTDGVAPRDTLEAARSRVTIAEAALAQARADAGRAEADLGRARAERAQAQADVAFNEAQLQNTIIRAPFTGTVVRKMAEVGESVAPIPPGVNISTASGAIVALADLDTLEVEVDVAEANVARLMDGQPAEVIVEAFPDRTYRGVLRQVIPTADRTRATVMVKVTILDTDAKLKPEMSAKVTFVEPPRADREGAGTVLVVPQSAVVTREGTSRVFAVVDGVAEARPVTLGDTRQDRVVVRDGLSAGDTIIARPPDSLKAGDRVRVKGA
ncbi:MAG: efflux RND transporter periplasmic adaptor subunit [Acidobacteriota bacterium]